MRKKIKFTEEQIKNIVKLYESEETTRSIGKIYGVSKNIISRLLSENNVELRNSGQKFKGGKKVSDKKWRDKNKENERKRQKKWVNENREHTKNYMKKYRIENADKLREQKRNYVKKRRNEDPLFKLISNFRIAMYTVLKEQKLTKRDHYFQMLGYTHVDLIDQSFDDRPHFELVKG